MTTPKQQTFASRVRAAVEAPFGERWRQPLIEASVFFTYTFHRRHFEEHLLPELYGLPERGERGARLALLQQQFSRTARPVVLHDDHVPVERDENGALIGAAALAGTASFRLDTVPVRWGRGGSTCMHAKHILLRVRDAAVRRRGSPREALVLVTTSANLTLAGWRQNLELADIQCLVPGQATPLREGLLELLDDAWGWAARTQRRRGSGGLGGLQRIQDVVDTLQQADARLPRLWTGREGLEQALADAVSDSEIGPIEHLSAGAPFLGEDGAPLRRLIERLAPEQVAVLRPSDHQGLPMSTPDWERAVSELPGSGSSPTIHSLLNDVLDPKKPRTTHLKWIYAEGASGAVLVLGSPNLSDPAFGPHRRPNADALRPGTNYETAILLPAPRGLRLLDPSPAEPLSGAQSPDSELDPNGPGRVETAPFFITYDWSKEPSLRSQAVASDEGASSPDAMARIRIVGGDGGGVELDLHGHQLGPAASKVVHDALEHSPFVELLAAEGNDRQPLMVSIVELRQDHAPARARFGLTLDQWLRFVTATSLEDWRRAEREADRIDRLREERAEFQQRSSRGRPPIELDRPIRIIQAVQSLEQRALEALDQGDAGALTRTLIESGGMSLRSLVEFHLSGSADHPSDDAAPVPSAPDEQPDLVDRLVCWLCVRTLLDDLRPKLPSEVRSDLAALAGPLARMEEAWDELEDVDRMKLKTWMKGVWLGPKKPKGPKGSTPLPATEDGAP
jgi:hypothetical protein